MGAAIWDSLQVFIIFHNMHIDIRREEGYGNSVVPTQARTVGSREIESGQTDIRSKN
jgi:hypothetical protein